MPWEERGRLGRAGVQGKSGIFPLANARAPEMQKCSHQVSLQGGDSSREHVRHPDLEDELRVLQEAGQPWGHPPNHAALGSCPDSATSWKSHLTKWIPLTESQLPLCKMG